MGVGWCRGKQVRWYILWQNGKCSRLHSNLLPQPCNHVAPELCLYLLAPTLTSFYMTRTCFFYAFICEVLLFITLCRPQQEKKNLYLLADCSSHSYWEKSYNAPAQVFSFSLLTEQTQLLFLLLVQRITVLGLKKTQKLTSAFKQLDLKYVCMITVINNLSVNYFNDSKV